MTTRQKVNAIQLMTSRKEWGTRLRKAPMRETGTSVGLGDGSPDKEARP